MRLMVSINLSPTVVKRLIIALTVIGILVVGATVIYDVARPKTTIVLGDGTFTAKVLEDEDMRQRGLSGVKSLGLTDAMLFVFPRDDTWGIWMKDMHFSIDIIWLDKERTVIHMIENASPESYPESFKPTKNARYVVEVNAGVAKEKSVHIGSKVRFDIDKGVVE